MTTNLTTRLLAGLCTALLLACQSADVVVLDDKGAPLAGATVEPVTPSINHPALTTNAKGEASFSASVQKIETINVRKAGFKDQTGIKVSGTKPLRVTLSP